MTFQPRKVLTPAQMGAVDRATIEAGIPGIVLMENAALAAADVASSMLGPGRREVLIL